MVKDACLDREFEPHYGLQVSKTQNVCSSLTSGKFNIVGSLRDQKVGCSASDRQVSNFESCVWRAVSSNSSHHPQEFLLARFRLCVHKACLKPHSFHFFSHGHVYQIKLV